MLHDPSVNGALSAAGADTEEINAHTTTEVDRAIAAYPTPSSADATNAHVTSETNRAISAYPAPSSADATNAHVTSEAELNRDLAEPMFSLETPIKIDVVTV